MIFKRKIYDEMLAWKQTQNGRTALLLKGARRVGKTTVAKEFAAREYQSYVLIDFAKTSDDIRSLFDDLSNLDDFFMKLQLFTHSRLQSENPSSFWTRSNSTPRQDRRSNIWLRTGATTTSKLDRCFP